MILSSSIRVGRSYTVVLYVNTVIIKRKYLRYSAQSMSYIRSQALETSCMCKYRHIEYFFSL